MLRLLFLLIYSAHQCKHFTKQNIWQSHWRYDWLLYTGIYVYYNLLVFAFHYLLFSLSRILSFLMPILTIRKLISKAWCLRWELDPANDLWAFSRNFQSFRLKTVYKYWASARSHKQCFTQNKSNTHRERNTLTQKKVIIYQVFFSFFFFFRFEIKQNEITKQRGKKRNALTFTYKVFFWRWECATREKMNEKKLPGRLNYMNTNVQIYIWEEEKKTIF